MIAWDTLTTTREDLGLITQIVHRAAAELPGYADRPSMAMDLEACHSCGCPLDLPALLAAKPGDFAHDVSGIRHHLDRDTGALGDSFTPRNAQR